MPRTPPTELIDCIRALSAPYAPEPAEITPGTSPLPHIRAVLFNVHGTLISSQPPGMAVATGTSRSTAFQSALAAAGWENVHEPPGFDPVEAFIQAREDGLASKRRAGIAHPDIDIRDPWRETLARLTKTPAKKIDDAAIERFIVELECRVDPPSPMPGLQETRVDLRARGYRLGLLAESQFFTPLMLEALLGESLDRAGLDPECRIYSHEVGETSPSPRFFEEAVIALENELAILADEVLYVGSDLQRAIEPAAEAGFRTALFAGDVRSLRLQDQDIDPEPPPDRILTDLRQLSAVLTSVKATNGGRYADLEADLGDDD